MRRKYRDCQRGDGNCAVCSLVNYGRDCHNRPITNLELARLNAGMTQQELADRSGVNIRQIQKAERGEIEVGNMTARNLLAIADVFGVDARKII